MDRKQERIAKKIEKLLAKADVEAFSVVMSDESGVKIVEAGNPVFLVVNAVALDDYVERNTHGKLKVSYENAKKIARNSLSIDATY